MSKIRIGLGYDVHRLVEGRDFWLGGIQIQHSKGALGHSDADVLIHAICDAILGALALGDIGLHYPDTDQKWKGVDSKVLLADVREKMKKTGYGIVNIDTMLSLEKPKIKSYIPQMTAILANVLEVSVEQISIKATTNESMGFVGREEGLSAQAIVLLEKFD
jgi:2-C-methyl-D-erythritol 2,4-cyclodiphosphate synthase